jgi:CDP-paratose 2-epimerase
VKLQWEYVDSNRMGDHIWWIGDLHKFRSHYPSWNVTYDVEAILRESYEVNVDKWVGKGMVAL